MNEHLRVVIFEDEPLYRALLIEALDTYEDLTIVGSFDGSNDSLHEVVELQPDVALLDIELGDGDTGVQIGLKIRRHLSDVGIVLLSNYDEPGLLKSLPQDEVAGWSYLLKRSVVDVAVLRRAIVGAKHGLVVLDPLLVQALLPVPGTAMGALTSRQRDIIALIAQGYSNAAIASRLDLSPKSVENYITQVYQVLGIDASEPGMHPRVRATLLYLEGHRRS